MTVMQRSMPKALCELRRIYELEHVRTAKYLLAKETKQKSRVLRVF